MSIVCTMPVWDESKFVVWAEGPPGLEVERNKVEPTAAILGNQIRPRKGSENLRGGGGSCFFYQKSQIWEGLYSRTRNGSLVWLQSKSTVDRTYKEK